jgi:hypothetical protein
MSISERTHCRRERLPCGSRFSLARDGGEVEEPERKVAIVAESFEETWPGWSKSASSTFSILRFIFRSLAKMVQR